MRKVTILVTAIALLGLAGNASAALSDGLVGQWDFDGTTGLEATAGSDLTLTGTQTKVTGTDASDGAYQVGDGDYYTVSNSPETNTWTLLMDIKAMTALGYNSLAEINGLSNDGDIFLRYSFDCAVGGTSRLGGYSSRVVAQDTWYRLVITVDMDAGEDHIYLDGTEIYLGTPNGFNMRSTLDLFSDCGGGEEGDVVVSNAAIWNRVVSDTEAGELGNAGDAIPEPATLVLLGIGGIGALLKRRRKSRA